MGGDELWKWSVLFAKPTQEFWPASQPFHSHKLFLFFKLWNGVPTYLPPVGIFSSSVYFCMRTGPFYWDAYNCLLSKVNRNLIRDLIIYTNSKPYGDRNIARIFWMITACWPLTPENDTLDPGHIHWAISLFLFQDSPILRFISVA